MFVTIIGEIWIIHMEFKMKFFKKEKNVSYCIYIPFKTFFTMTSFSMIFSLQKHVTFSQEYFFKVLLHIIIIMQW